MVSVRISERMSRTMDDQTSVPVPESLEKPLRDAVSPQIATPILSKTRKRVRNEYFLPTSRINLYSNGRKHWAMG